MYGQDWQTSRVIVIASLVVTSSIAGSAVSVGAQPSLTAVETAGDGSSTTPQIEDVRASDLSGSGTPSDPYRVSNVSELQAMEDDLDASYVLVSDINASTTTQASSGAGFNPIGSKSNKFEGVVDGQGYTIDQLTITRPTTEDVGLFAVTGSEAELRSLTLTNVDITGQDDVGGVVGDAEGQSTIQNVSVDGTVSGSTDTGGVIGVVEERSVVRRATMTGTVTGSDNIGGVVGSNTGGIVTISAARATVTATGQDRGGDRARAGGLVGGTFNTGIINRSYATGQVVGGKAGGITGEVFNGSRVTDTYAVGDIQGRTDRGTGGVTGDNIRDCPFPDSQRCENYQSTSVTDSYWDIATTNQSTSEGDTTGLTTAEMQGSAAAQNMTNLDFGETWQAVDDDYPELVALSTSSASDPRARALQIADVDKPANITQNDITAAITLRDRGQQANGVDITQNDITTLITIRNRAN